MTVLFFGLNLHLDRAGGMTDPYARWVAVLGLAKKRLILFAHNDTCDWYRCEKDRVLTSGAIAVSPILREEPTLV